MSGKTSSAAVERPVVAHLNDARAITTSLSAYGGTAQRRTSADRSITPVAEALEEVLVQAGGQVHLVGHSFGGRVLLAVALRRVVPLLSLTIFEAPAPSVLTAVTEAAHLAAFLALTDA